MDLFDKNDTAEFRADMDVKHAAAVAARDDGIERSAQTSGEQWVEYAVGMIRCYLETHATMHVDELWDFGLVTPESPRALGAAMVKARQAGWMVPIKFDDSDGWVAAKPSKRSNMQLKAVWRSTISVRR